MESHNTSSSSVSKQVVALSWWLGGMRNHRGRAKEEGERLGEARSLGL